ncbi:hypothetical protein K8I61_09635 [bacterium]|nr:hypothetical protein [bacterium]
MDGLDKMDVMDAHKRRIMPAAVFAALFALALFAASCSCGDDDDDDSALTDDDAQPEDDDADDDDTQSDDDDDDDSGAPDAGFRYLVAEDGSLSLRYGAVEVLRAESVHVLRQTTRANMLFGFFRFFGGDIESAVAARFAVIDGEIVLVAGGEIYAAVSIDEMAEGVMRLSFAAPPGDGDVYRLAFSIAPNDRFWGFGEQYNFVDLRGQTLDIWTQEQGVGRAADSIVPTVGGLTDTYFPMPWWIDPVKSAGVLLDHPGYARYDVGAADPGRLTIEMWDANEVSLVVIAGDAPRDVVRRLTAHIGRTPAAPPDWAIEGVWLAAQGGTDAMLDRVETARDAGVPVSAVWAQDWVGHRAFGLGNHGVKYHWTHDDEEYPNLADAIATLAADGVRFLGYFNPFVVPRLGQYDEGEAAGYLITREDGSVYKFPVITFFGTLADFTNAGAVAWFQDHARDALDLGMSGWMADFGEWLPYDAVIANGEAPRMHNLYPTLWHAANREVLEERRGEDFVLLTRSGYTGEHGVAQIVWAGDQEADWSTTDGLPTVVTAGLTIGLSGVPYFTHDIAGFSGGPSTKELFLRWTELGAFTPFMRTHDGLKKDENHRFDSDAETLDHFTRFSRAHEAMFPYFRALADEALTDGLPMIRHTALVDPSFDDALEAHAQWMIGDDLLFAPVVAEGAASVEAVFPRGAWTHLVSGETIDGPATTVVAAPIGTPAVYFRAGSPAQAPALAARTALAETQLKSTQGILPRSCPRL